MGRGPLGLARDCAGATAVEFALIAPVVCFFLVTGMYFMLAVFQYLSLTEGMQAGARQLAASVNDSTPYTDAVAAIEAAAPTLNTTSLSIAISVNNTACTTDTKCSSLMAGGVAATVSGTYPCNLSVMGYDFLPNCQLTSTVTEMTE